MRLTFTCYRSISISISIFTCASYSICRSISIRHFYSIGTNIAGLTNSIKYTDAGGYLKLTTSVRPLSSNDGSPGTEIVELSCADSGRGQKQGYLNNGLWKAFSQEYSDPQGTGLGLSLIHNIVKEAGRNIEVSSSKGVGEFSASLSLGCSL